MELLSLLFLGMMQIGHMLSNVLFILLVALLVLAVLMSLCGSIYNVGLPLMRARRPLASFVMTIITTFALIVPTIHYITIKLTGGLNYENKR